MYTNNTSKEKNREQREQNREELAVSEAKPKISIAVKMKVIEMMKWSLRKKTKTVIRPFKCCRYCFHNR